ncbi:MAG: hypothetical protein PGN13_12735 [Patulibacter minatonensis]
MPRSNEADRHLLLRAALRAYPPADREGYGDELLEAAIELSADSSAGREALGLVRGGVEARVARLRLGLRSIALRAALSRLALPLTAFVVAIWAVAGVGRIVGTTHGPNHSGLTLGAVVLLTLVVAVASSVASQRRLPATIGAGALALWIVASLIWQSARGNVVTAAPVLHLNIGSWWFGPSFMWALIPLVLLLVPACWCMPPAAPRVPDLRRPWVEYPPLRLVTVVLPAAVLGVILLRAPQVLVEPVTRETTEIPGIAFLMVLVGVLWVATSPAFDDRLGAACALVGLAAVPSVAYGAARLLMTGLTDLIAARDLYVVAGVVCAGAFIVFAIWFFVVVLAHIGLRAVDRRGGSPLAVGHAVVVGPDDPAQI